MGVKRMGLLSVIAAAAVLAGCARDAVGTPDEPRRRTAVLKQGTEVKLILLRQIESGGTPVGEEVPLMAVEDVRDSEGNVLIPRGGISYAEVTRSRNATWARAVINQPARLSINIDRTFSIDGKEVKLKTEIDDPEAVYILTRGETGPDMARRLEEVWGEESQEILKGLQEMFNTGRAPAITSDRAVAELIERLNMPNTVTLVRQGGIDQVAAILKSLESGAVKAITGGEVLLLIGAVNELANLAGHVGRRVGGIFTGANIRAYPGTPVTAYVEEDVTIELPAGSR